MLLSDADRTRIKATAERTYPSFPPLLREVFNQQMQECRGPWDIADWLERVELTAKYFQGDRPRLGHRKAKPKVEAN